MAVAEARDFGFGKFRDRGSTFTDSILWTRLPVGAFLCYVNGYCSSFCCCPAESAVTPPPSGETFRIHDRRESEKRHEILDLVGPPLHSRRILQISNNLPAVDGLQNVAFVGFLCVQDCPSCPSSQVPVADGGSNCASQLRLGHAEDHVVDDNDDHRPPTKRSLAALDVGNSNPVLRLFFQRGMNSAIHLESGRLGSRNDQGTRNSRMRQVPAQKPRLSAQYELPLENPRRHRVDPS
ncbi:hypothetical protein HN011_000047 [Eciton burchellii]|nr:hypothetical protein HN011_000047 [Eciton burchellii]